MSVEIYAQEGENRRFLKRFGSAKDEVNVWMDPSWIVCWGLVGVSEGVLNAVTDDDSEVISVALPPGSELTVPLPNGEIRVIKVTESQE